MLETNDRNPVFRNFWRSAHKTAIQVRDRQIIRLIWASRDKWLPSQDVCQTKAE